MAVSRALSSILIITLLLCASSCKKPRSSKSGMTIKGYSISPRYLNFIFAQRTMITASLPPYIRMMIRHGIADHLIQRELLAEMGRAKGFSVSNKDVEKLFSRETPKYMLNGQKALLPVATDRKSITEWLAKWKVPYDEFMKEQRRNLLALRFQDLWTESVTVTEKAVKEEFILTSTRVAVDFVEFDPTTVPQKLKMKPPKEPMSKEALIKLTEDVAQGYIKRIQQGETIKEIFVSQNLGDPDIALAKKQRAPFKFTSTSSFPNVPSMGVRGIGKTAELLKQLFMKRDGKYLHAEGEVLPRPHLYNDKVYLVVVRLRDKPDWEKWTSHKKEIFEAARVKKAYDTHQPTIFALCNEAAKNNEISIHKAILQQGYKPKKDDPPVGEYKPCAKLNPKPIKKKIK